MSPARGPGPDELLSPEFIAQLHALRGLLFRRRSVGELRGSGFGPTPEFDTHRPYEPGDDPRSIDWNAYARTEKLLLKLFIREEERQVCVMLDASASMRAAGGRKAALAARFAAAFAYLALAAGRPLLAGAFAERFLGARGPLQALEQLPEALRFFATPPRGGATRFGPSMAELLGARRGRVLLVVVSDFLQEDEVPPQIAWLRRSGHELHLVQILDDRELRPTLRGACAIEDVEGDGRIALLAGHDFLTQLRAEIERHVGLIAAACRGLLVPHALVRASAPFERTFLDHLTARPAQ